MTGFTRADQLHFEAAQGWLELGDWEAANDELDELSPLIQTHPDVLQVRVKIYCKAEKWLYAAEVADALCRMLPESAYGPLHLAYALRKLERIDEAHAALLPVADQFPNEWRIPYQLACYACKRGRLEDALRWIDSAIDVAGKVDIRMKALDEPDLEPLWLNISEF